MLYLVTLVVCDFLKYVYQGFPTHDCQKHRQDNVKSPYSLKRKFYLLKR